jgi:hypothetical protein
MMVRAMCVAALACSLAGCAAVGDVTGAVAGLVSGAVTANPAVGISVGIAVRAGTNEAVRSVSRKRQRNEQDAIAAVAAGLDVGEAAPWAVDQRLAGDAYGEVRVLRVIETPLTRCKELLFSVLEGEEENAPRAWFTTTACEGDQAWRWAAAEPAVDRWTNLQ